jgi:hypothetical protein
MNYQSFAENTGLANCCSLARRVTEASGEAVWGDYCLSLSCNVTRVWFNNSVFILDPISRWYNSIDRFRCEFGTLLIRLAVGRHRIARHRTNSCHWLSNTTGAWNSIFRDIYRSWQIHGMEWLHFLPPAIRDCRHNFKSMFGSVARIQIWIFQRHERFNIQSQCLRLRR